MPSSPDTHKGLRFTSLAEHLRQLLSGGGLGWVLAFLVSSLVAAYSLWYTSSGQFPVFPAIQNDYVDLGRAFLSGQLSLLEKPDARLAELPNPYEYKERRDIPYHWDASYYAGKYYLYWGPVPAVVSAALELIFRAEPSASVLVVLPYILLLFVFLALLFQIAHLFPAAATRNSVWLFTLMGFFNLPMLFLIGQPRHYQASIIYGQLFLLSGLLAFAIFTTNRRPAWLAVSGLGWGLAVACRYNLAISVGMYVLFALWQIVREPRRAHFLRTLGSLILPLALCVLALGLYDFARFGNPLETGLTYQLTIPEFQKITYSLSYVPSNLYVYLVYPLTSADTFPFIQSAHFHPALLPDWLTVPKNREVDQVVLGLFRSAPIVWLVVLALPFLVLIARDVRGRRPLSREPGSPLPLLAMIAAAAAGQFVFLMVFFYAAERYVADFFLPVILCLAFIVWRVDESLRAASVARSLLWLSVVGLTAWTVGIGYFGCFGVPTLVSNFYDPGMLASIASFWNGIYAALQAIGGTVTRLIPV